MSLHLPARRALRAAAATSLKPPAVKLSASMQQLSLGASTAQPAFNQLTQTRTILGWMQRRKRSKPNQELDFVKDVEKGQESEVEALQKKMGTAKLDGSIFADELEGGGPGADGQSSPSASTSSIKLRNGGTRSHDAMARAVDPDPRSRVRWERKMVARMVGRRLDPWDRETRGERLARTERRFVSRGPVLHTSTKKLVHLAHQVAGKTLDEAMVQMRFSKKKYAREIGVQLDAARDEAAVVAGMGLGPVAASSSAAPGQKAEGFVPMRIQTKDGKWLTVDDPTKLYIEEAWVNRGPFVFAGYHYSGRGRSNIKWTRTSNLTVVVKEEKTRIRQHEEREKKKALKAPWVHLPNRPVTAQRQHYSW